MNEDVLVVKMTPEYAEKNFKINRFRATIASFNKRALNLCIKAGFDLEQEITHAVSKNKFTIITRVAL